MTRPASYWFFLYIQFSFTAQCSEESKANFTNISNFNLNFKFFCRPHCQTSQTIYPKSGRLFMSKSYLPRIICLYYSDVKRRFMYQNRPSKSHQLHTIWPGGPDSYSSKISGTCTRTDWNAIWLYFASIRCCLLRQYNLPNFCTERVLFTLSTVKLNHVSWSNHNSCVELVTNQGFKKQMS